MDIQKVLMTLGVVIAATQFSACSSGPPPKAELSLAQASIRSAEAANAASYAPKSLRTAQQKVVSAESYMADKKNKKAKMLLTQALADAELAEAYAEAHKAKLAYEELQQSIDLMKQEIARVQD